MGEEGERRGRGEKEERERRERGEGEERKRRGRGEKEERKRRGRGEKEERERRLVMVSYIVWLPMQWHLPMLPPRQKKCISSS